MAAPPNALLSPYAPIRYRHQPLWRVAEECARRGLFLASGKMDAEVGHWITENVTKILDTFTKEAGGMTSHIYPDLAAETHRWGAFAGLAAMPVRQNGVLKGTG